MHKYSRYFGYILPIMGKRNAMLFYKVNVLVLLKNAGYNQTVLKKTNVLSHATVQSLRENKVVGIKSIDTICTLLKCQPGDIIGWREDAEE